MAREYDVAIVGESKYQAEIEGCIEGESVTLYHEHDNRRDPNAIMVVSARGEKIGYIPRNSWLRRVLIDEGRKLSSSHIKHITGGWGDKANLGVVLTVTLLTRKEAAAMEAELAAQAAAAERQSASWSGPITASGMVPRNLIEVQLPSPPLAGPEVRSSAAVSSPDATSDNDGLADHPQAISVREPTESPEDGEGWSVAAAMTVLLLAALALTAHLAG